MYGLSILKKKKKGTKENIGFTIHKMMGIIKILGTINVDRYVKRLNSF